MGGLIVREAIQRAYPRLTGRTDAADQAINKIVTLGTPHQGISFQVIRELAGSGSRPRRSSSTSTRTNRRTQRNQAAWVNFHKHFPLERLLTVVGTNYRSYGVRASTWANRLFAVGGEYGPNYNRSDGLVKQAYAQIPARRAPSSTSATAASTRWSPHGRPTRSRRGSSSATSARGCV